MKENLRELLKHYSEKFEDDRKGFHSVLNLLAYKSGITGVSTPVIPLEKYEGTMMKVSEMIGEKYFIENLREFFYEEGLNKKPPSRCKKLDIQQLLSDNSHKSFLLVQDFDIRCGESISNLHEIAKNKTWLIYGVSPEFSEYKIALLTKKFLRTKAFLICASADDISKDICSPHWNLANSWNKTTKKHL